MIIIKTRNGDRFLNEAEVILVSHMKNCNLVHVHFARQCTPEQTPYVTITDVEAVIYTTNKEIEWYDKSSSMEEPKTSLDWQNDTRLNIV